MQRIEAKVAPVQIPVRRYKFNPKDFKTIGFTPNCAGCIALREGTHNPGHDEDCRERVEQHLGTTDAGRKRLQQSQDRENRILSRMVKQQVQQQEQTQQGEQASSSDSGISRGSKRPAVAEGEKTTEPPPTQILTQMQQEQQEQQEQIQQRQKQRRTVSFENQQPSAQEQSQGDAPDHEGDVSMSIDVDAISTNIHDNNECNKNNRDNNKANKEQDYTVTLYFNTKEQQSKAYICAVQRNLVTEVYSPPRVVQFADKHGLTPGHSIDIKCCDEQGNPWDLNEHKQRNKLIQLVTLTKPILVIGSPMCTMFSILQNLKKQRN